jgi:hypothetical protein
MRATALVIIGVLALAACGDDDATQSSEYKALLAERDELAADLDDATELEQQLAEAQANLEAAEQSVQELQTELDTAAAAADEDADEAASIRTSFVDFLSLVMSQSGGPEAVDAGDADCIAEAIVDDPEARSAFPILLSYDQSVEMLEASTALARAFESCGLDIGDFAAPDVLEGNAYGDNPTLDALYDSCAAGDGAACDELYWSSSVDTEYEQFAVTCGNRFGSAEEAPLECAGNI